MIKLTKSYELTILDFCQLNIILTNQIMVKYIIIITSKFKINELYFFSFIYNKVIINTIKNTIN